VCACARACACVRACKMWYKVAFCVCPVSLILVENINDSSYWVTGAMVMKYHDKICGLVSMVLSHVCVLSE